MKKVLVNVVHQNLDTSSRVNKTLVEFTKNESNVTINNLYEKYGDFKIDVKKEQELLLQNDVIIFQFPMYWLSSPALLKEYLDVVLEYNFAYGDSYKLENKILAICTSTGASFSEFTINGANKYSVEDFLKPFEAIANYIKMKYEKPFITYETFVLSDEKLEKIAQNYVKYIDKLKRA